MSGAVVQARDIHGGVYIHNSHAEPVGQIVTGLIPHEPPNFQVPPQVAELAESVAVCVVTGPRGIGKTQIAAAYARQRVRDGWLVAWIGAETVEQAQAGMAELGVRLGVNWPGEHASVTATRVRDHLQSHPGPVLLILDNVVSLDLVLPLMPSAGTARVVITTTVRGSHLGREVAVDVFDTDTALRLLHSITGLNDDVGAAELAREVGHLPLALAQAAARIRAGGWSYATYLTRFRRYPVEKHLSRRDGDPYPLGAARAILIALEPFQGSEALEALALLAPEGVPRWALGEHLDDELALLYEASLVEHVAESHVRTHRLVQRVVRDSCRTADTYETALQRVAGRLETCMTTVPFHPADPWVSPVLLRQVKALIDNVGGRREREAVADVPMRIAKWAWRVDLQSLGAQVDLLIDISPEPPSEDSIKMMENVFWQLMNGLGEENRYTLKAARALSRAYTRAGRPEEVRSIILDAHTTQRFG